MKKILIVASCVKKEGGIGVSLYNMLLEMHKISTDIDITLLLFDENSIKNVVELPLKVILAKQNYELSIGVIKLMKQILLKKIPVKVLFHRFLYKMAYRLPLLDDYAYSYELLDEDFDTAISYNTIPGYISNYVINCVNAKNKIIWAHNSVDQKNRRFLEKGSLLRVKGLRQYRKVLNKANKIYAVSEGAKNSIIDIITPNVPIEVFYNFTDKNRIIKKSFEPLKINADKAKLIILSVGRISFEKGIKLSLKVANKLKKSGYLFIWYFVGSLDQEKYVNKYISRHKLQDNIVVTGVIDNPYPLFRACDIYVQTSYAEGYCTTTNEARMLGKPVITTDVAGSQEQIINGKNGFVVKKNVDSIFDSIVYMIKNKEKRLLFGDYNSNINFDNNESMAKLKELLYEK